MHTMCPMYQYQMFVNGDINLSTDPIIIIIEPNEIHFLRPKFSIIQIEVKFIGKYKNRSEYLAQLRFSSSISSSILSIIQRFVLNDPCTVPVAAEVKKKAASTIQRYLYKMREGF